MMEYALLNFLLMVFFISIAGWSTHSGLGSGGSWGAWGEAWLFRTIEILRIVAMPFP